MSWKAWGRFVEYWRRCRGCDGGAGGKYACAGRFLPRWRSGALCVFHLLRPRTQTRWTCWPRCAYPEPATRHGWRHAGSGAAPPWAGVTGKPRPERPPGQGLAHHRGLPHRSPGRRAVGLRPPRSPALELPLLPQPPLPAMWRAPRTRGCRAGCTEVAAGAGGCARARPGAAMRRAVSTMFCGAAQGGAGWLLLLDQPNARMGRSLCTSRNAAGSAARYPPDAGRQTALPRP